MHLANAENKAQSHIPCPQQDASQGSSQGSNLSIPAVLHQIQHTLRPRDCRLAASRNFRLGRISPFVMMLEQVHPTWMRPYAVRLVL